MRFEGNREWNWQMRGMNDRQLLAAAEFARREQVWDRTINAADRTREEHDFSLRFVSPFKDLVTRQSTALSLDPSWVFGLVRQESRFILNARSHVGASGLMQLMPATARQVARQIGLRQYDPGQIDDIETNVLLGTTYMRTRLDDLDGSYVLASAAYNAGIGRARQWRASLSRPVEGAIFAETIPFSETRDYVKKVLSNAVYYAALFDHQAPSLKKRLGIIQPATNGSLQ
jgi:soluble lytic murein transglycosylase